jgi:hypothetical protein
MSRYGNDFLVLVSDVEENSAEGIVLSPESLRTYWIIVRWNECTLVLCRFSRRSLFQLVSFALSDRLSPY